MTAVLGLDIGGANTKSCYLEIDKGNTFKANGNSVYFEMWKYPNGLKEILKDLLIYYQIPENGIDCVALTMTAELCDGFESKRQGVLSILGIAEDVFSDIPVYVWTTDGVFARLSEIKERPMRAAAANWLASATALAKSLAAENCSLILVDMGSTTTDIIPLGNGQVLAKGKTDPERLLTGELLYTGLLRTSVNTLLKEVFIDGYPCQIANEYFAVCADAYRYLGKITEKEYNIPTPDGGGRDIQGCAKRLARIVAAEPEDIGMKNIYWIARYLQEKQTEQIINNILRIVSRKDFPFPKKIIYTGQGSFLINEAAERLGLETDLWWRMLPGAQPKVEMACYAVAWLLSQELLCSK